MSKGLPRVSVVCITYNHEQYLAEALDSFIAQQTTFPFKILVGDDCSNDGTRGVLSEYVERHPDLITPYYRERNYGAQRNLIDLCKRAGTEYIAFCEGDDYWTDPLKLQKQFDFMELCSDLRACFHDTLISTEGLGHEWFLAHDYSNTEDGTLKWSTGHKLFSAKDRYSIKDYIPCGFVHTSSMFFRWDYSLRIPDWYFEHLVGDYTIWALQVGLGAFGFINETMSVYRKNSGGCYDFESREEFWDKTKDDWLTIDQQLFDYFASIGAEPSLLETIRRRQVDDLTKLLKAKVRIGSYKSLVDACRNHAALIRDLTGLKVPNRDSLRPTLPVLLRLNSDLKFVRRKDVRSKVGSIFRRSGQ